MIKTTWLAAAPVTAALLVGGCGGWDDAALPSSSASTAAPVEELSVLAAAVAATSLAYMREEEKLARDLYAAMHAQWKHQVFGNIAESERTHTGGPDADRALRAVRSGGRHRARGVRRSRAAGAVRRPGCARAGEPDRCAAGRRRDREIDIRDIRAAKASIDNADILRVYTGLEKGSRNHLRAFQKELLRVSVTYAPKYISQEEYDTIVGSPRETGVS